VSSFRNVAMRLYPIWFRLLSCGRVVGRRYILRKPLLVRVSKNAILTIGAGVHIEPFSRLVFQANSSIGPEVYIGKNSTIVGFSTLRIGARTLIGENVSIHTENHGPAGNRMAYSSENVTIGEDVWIGAGVVITSGVSIGDRVTVGANSVVNKSFGSDVMIAGVPARVIRQLNE